MCLVLLTGPFLHVLGLIPRGVCRQTPFPDIPLTPVIYIHLAFRCSRRSFYMGLDTLSANGIMAKIHFLLWDRTLTSPVDPLHNVQKSGIMLFTLIEHRVWCHNGYRADHRSFHCTPQV
ncbi:hypothetical protein JB92DRAFT_3145058 [Gautieria morchelliformis]|nr:hypothetical protein JB92DRAFT_3145058 [Gautieria morchelliformis]